ncbi:MAG: DUF2796 domain-containing protein [Desulfovibrio sp.]|nr:DUF2796 domain-containing protein [Desulfovibrio sp.]
MLKSLLFLFLLLCSLPVSAHEAHVHGLAHLNMALEGAGGELELHSAQANFLPFEHAPQTAEEKQAAQALLGALGKPETLFLLSPEAQCRLQVTSLSAELLEAGHAHEAGHEHVAGHEHANIHLVVAFTCQQPEKLHSLELALFAQFPALHEVELACVGPDRQSGAHLRPAERVFRW